MSYIDKVELLLDSLDEWEKVALCSNARIMLEGYIFDPCVDPPTLSEVSLLKKLDMMEGIERNSYDVPTWISHPDELDDPNRL